MRSEAEIWQAAPIGLTLPLDRIDIWRVCREQKSSLRRHADLAKGKDLQMSFKGK